MLCGRKIATQNLWWTIWVDDLAPRLGCIQPNFFAFVACLFIREVLIFTLPDHIAGPGGWLIDTGSDEA